MNIDIFNGDADGICALHQLRLANPVENVLVTGVKRDINLLSKVSIQTGDFLTVLDISLDKNRTDLIRLLDAGAKITYFDHHFAGDIPSHPDLTVTIDTSSDTCTSLLVNQALNNKYLPWAVTAAFGDNLFDSAINAASPLNLSANKLELLKTLGICINYNGYGSSIDDLFYHPAELYKIIHHYEDPFDFILSNDAFSVLRDGYEEDMAKATNIDPESDSPSGTAFILPDTKWARRVAGIFGNALAQSNPEKAHAVLTQKAEDVFQVSVRAPLDIGHGADDLCRQFATGGGRKAAAGINELPESEVSAFINAFQNHF